MRKNILLTAYAMHPYKGSEDGLGWNYVLQVARFNNVIAVTRCNNQPAIEQYWNEHPEMAEARQHIRVLYFDWPQWMIFWKKGPLLAMIYFWLWQLSLPLWLSKQSLHIDIAHNLNFHSNWMPTFLWLLGKPLVWGPVGHHPKIPRQYLLPVYGWKAYLMDRFLWLIKSCFWAFDPFLAIAKQKAQKVLCINSESLRKTDTGKGSFSILPAIAAEPATQGSESPAKFSVLSIGRFVPLKGFDLTIKAFSRFIHELPLAERDKTELVLIGAGPCEHTIKTMIAQEGIADYTRLIAWMPRAELPALYRQSSVFLFPSFEGAGMVVIEAMAHAIPVICWDNSGPGESTPPESGLKVPYGSYNDGVSQFAAILNRLYHNPALLRNESQLASQHYQQHYDWTVRGEQLEAIYANILPSSKAVLAGDAFIDQPALFSANSSNN